MIEWLRGEVADPHVAVAGRRLPIAIRRHPRARRLTMRLSPEGSELRITLPTWGRTMDALAFAKARTAWIEAQLARVPAPQDVGPGARIPFRGESLTVEWQPDARRLPRLEGSALVLGGPAERIAPRIRQWLEQEALRLTGEDLAFYCARAACPTPGLGLSRAQRRWGSCSGPTSGLRARAPSIRINWRLVMAPDYVRRSVVAHEVAHLAHFDHSPAFHAHLAQLFEGDLRAADGWLRREGRGLYAQFG
jgi:predicted metal-dependent hydrolase